MQFTCETAAWRQFVTHDETPLRDGYSAVIVELAGGTVIALDALLTVVTGTVTGKVLPPVTANEVVKLAL